jgi:DNA-directed RNA polymerase sigma subunit (sigma70/sigma32)
MTTARRTLPHNERLSTLADTRAPRPQDTASDHEQAGEVWDRVAKLVTGRELDMLRLRFAEVLEFEDIGRLYDITWQRAWQICHRALGKIRQTGEELRASLGC